MFFAYVLFAGAVWSGGDQSGGEALMDPEGFLIIGGIFFALAAPLVVGLFFGVKSLLGGRPIKDRPILVTLAVLSLLFAALMITIGVSAALTPVEYYDQGIWYYQAPAWVIRTVAALYLLPGLTALWLTWKLAARAVLLTRV
ncbi:MAG: hypothetical protein IPK93_04760 [Solirubrobacterales bacterium]|nr:hypothetical protein [Solirubrobacterales bacterium]